VLPCETGESKERKKRIEEERKKKRRKRRKRKKERRSEREREPFVSVQRIHHELQLEKRMSCSCQTGTYCQHLSTKYELT